VAVRDILKPDKAAFFLDDIKSGQNLSFSEAVSKKGAS
jgi:hypothetical protein